MTHHQTFPNYLLFDGANNFLAPIAEHSDALIKWDLRTPGTGTITIPGLPSEDIFKACMSVHEQTTLIEVQAVNGKRWTGRVHNADYTDDGDGPVLEITVVNDMIWLGAMLALVNPDGTMTEQGIAEYDSRTGPTETVVKEYIADAAARLGIPMMVVPAPAADPSPIIHMNARMTKLDELIKDVLEPAGFGIEVYMHREGAVMSDSLAASGLDPVPGTLIVDVVPAVYNQWLKWSQEQLTKFSVSSSHPTAYRAITGGEGQKTERVFTEFIDNDLKEKLGIYALPEVYVDNTGTNGTEDENGAIVSTAAASPPTIAALAKARGGVAVSFDVDDGQPWFAGEDWWLAHYGTAMIAGQTFSAQITQVELKETVDGGIVYAPHFGDSFVSRDEIITDAIVRLAADIQRRRAQG